MKLEEAIAKAKILNDSLKELTDEYEGQGSFIAAGMAVSFKLVLDTILTALRPVSREQVEKVWRGEWNYSHTTETDHFAVVKCSKCGHEAFAIALYVKDENFCPHCGAPMTDEAVQMVMERLEALKDGRV
jgi:hypothetical protein|nr:MAG TPA: zinc-ribbon domain protein [Caudoviricetes sp.]